MTNYMIVDGLSNALTAGLSANEVEQVAQRLANSRRESVYYGPESGEEATEVKPEYIVIDDGQVKFPVLKTDVEAAGKSLTDLKAMDGEQYSAWCQDVPMDASRGAVGSQGCIDFCEELAETGAEVWSIG